MNIREATHFRLDNHQSVAYTGTAGTIANAVGSYTKAVRVYCTTDAFVKISQSPTATSADVPISAGIPEYFAIHPGEKVSAIQQSAGGTLHVTELTQ
jgi:hypothetical protein